MMTKKKLSLRPGDLVYINVPEGQGGCTIHNGEVVTCHDTYTCRESGTRAWEVDKFLCDENDNPIPGFKESSLIFLATPYARPNDLTDEALWRPTPKGKK